MHYSDIDRVLENIASYFNKRFEEKFEMDRDGRYDRYVIYQSSNYYFQIMVAFIQARVLEDLNETIELRLDKVLKDKDIKPGVEYLLTTKLVQNAPSGEIPIEYCVFESNEI